MGIVTYLLESQRQMDLGSHPYFDNKYEVEAKNYAQKNKFDLMECMMAKCGGKYTSIEEDEEWGD